MSAQSKGFILGVAVGVGLAYAFNQRARAAG